MVRSRSGTDLTLAYTDLDLRSLSQTSFGGQTLDGNALSGIPGDTFTGFLTYLFPPGSALSGLTLEHRPERWEPAFGKSRCGTTT